MNVLLVDDINGNEAKTIPFGLDGTGYQIDLGGGHAQELRGNWSATSRRPARSQDPPADQPGSAGPPKRYTRNKKIRTFAREGHQDVNERGRIPAIIVTQSEAANGK